MPAKSEHKEARGERARESKRERKTRRKEYPRAPLQDLRILCPFIVRSHTRCDVGVAKSRPEIFDQKILIWIFCSETKWRVSSLRMRIMTRGLGFPLFIMLSGLKPRVLRCKRLRQSYCSSSPAKGNDSEVLNKQLLKAGMSYLKDTEKTRKSVELRKLDINIDQLLVDYGKYQQILGKLDNALLEKKAEAGVVSSKGDVNEKGRSIDKLRDLKGTIKQLKTELHQMEKSLVPNVSRLPNNIHPNV
uniref:Uncharacterized protein n=1 Tax=Amphimedon queenslandica TaxID=400682 RepID=A0A1X7T8M1_AMPQE